MCLARQNCCNYLQVVQGHCSRMVKMNQNSRVNVCVLIGIYVTFAWCCLKLMLLYQRWLVIGIGRCNICAWCTNDCLKFGHPCWNPRCVSLYPKGEFDPTFSSQKTTRKERMFGMGVERMKFSHVKGKIKPWCKILDDYFTWFARKIVKNMFCGSGFCSWNFEVVLKHQKLGVTL